MDAAGIDMILIGDSVGSVFSGYDNTLPVTMDEMIYHTRAVVRGSEQALIVCDMPFMSYQTDIREARINAGRLIKDAGAQAVKLEGGEHMAATIRAIVEIDIPVVAHIGLTPQSVHRMGGSVFRAVRMSRPERFWPTLRRLKRQGPLPWCWRAFPATLPSR